MTAKNIQAFAQASTTDVLLLDVDAIEGAAQNNTPGLFSLYISGREFVVSGIYGDASLPPAPSVPIAVPAFVEALKSGNWAALANPNAAHTTAALGSTQPKK